MTVDDQHIYWANAPGGHGGSIGSANLDGTGVNQSLIPGTSGPRWVAVSVAVAQVSPASPSAFPTTLQGTLSEPLTLTLTNNGQRNLSVNGLSFTGSDAGDFIIGSNSCLGSVAPGQRCQFAISFAPQGEGPRAATLQIASNDYANNPIQVPLSGAGGSPR